MPSALPLRVIDLLSNADELLPRSRALVGLDGFVDIILHVVQTRESATSYTRMSAMKTFSERIAAAAGMSANFEFVQQMVKLGGNGPIMANAISCYGPEVTYIGNLGSPSIHPIFTDFAQRAKVVTIAEPGYTDAIEFDDGKLMCGKHASLKDITWENIIKHLPEEELLAKFSESSLIALVNWTMIPAMSAIFEKILARIAPKLEGERRWIFFDLADPAKRTAADIAEALGLIARFQEHFRAVLGLNLNESRQIGDVLGIKLAGDSHEAVTEHAAAIREKLGIETVVVHPTHFAAAADAGGATHVAGPFTDKPKITTGAGDHFNAGFCTGRLLGADLAGSLQIGVATSGYYVRQAQSPCLSDLRAILQTL